MDKKIATTLVITGAFLGSMATASITETEAGSVLEKHSDTEVKITTTNVQETTISLIDLKKKREEILKFKQMDQNTCDARNVQYLLQEQEIDALIAEAESKGVKEKVEE